LVKRQRADRILAMGVLLILATSAFTVAIAFPTSRSAEATAPAKYFAIYYVATPSSGTSYVNANGQEYAIQGSTTTALAYIPALNKTIWIGQSSSESYSQSFFDVYAESNRVFLMTTWMVNHEGQETLDIADVNVTNGQYTNTKDVTLWFFEPVSFAIVNDGLYFVPGDWYNMFAGRWEGGGLYLANLTTTKEKQLLDTTDPNEYGTLVSAGGNLFRYQFMGSTYTAKNGTAYTCPQYSQYGDCEVIINQVDLSTGRITRGFWIGLPQHVNGAFSDWAFTADANTIYLVAQTGPSENSTTVGIWEWTIPITEFENGNLATTLVSNHWWINSSYANMVNYTQPVQPARLLSVQACNGDLLLNMDGSLLLQDMSTGNVTIIPAGKNDAYLVYGAMAPALATSTTTTATTSSSNSTPTTTISSSNVTTTSSSTTTTRQIPEFPFQAGSYSVFISLAATVVIVAAYILSRRTSRRPR